MKKLKLKNLAVLIIFLLPTYLVRFKIFDWPTNLWELLAALWILLTFLKYRQALWERKKIRKHFKYLWLIGLVVLGLVLSWLKNGGGPVGLGIIKSWLLIPLVFAFLVALVSGEEKKKAFQAYYFSAFVIAGLGIIYYLLGIVTYDNRLEAVFNSPNYLAMYLAPAVIVGILIEKNSWRIYLLSLAVILVSLYFTYSYAAWAALAAALATVFFIKKGPANNWLSGLILLVILFFVAQLSSQKIIGLATLSGRSSLASRQMVWQAAQKMLSQNWFFGIGPGNFQEEYLRQQSYFPPYLEWAVPHPHNLYLAFWLYGGLLSLAGFLLLIFFWFRNFPHSPLGNLKWIAFGIITYILLHGLVDTTYFKNDLAVVFWLAFWLAL